MRLGNAERRDMEKIPQASEDTNRCIELKGMERNKKVTEWAHR